MKRVTTVRSESELLPTAHSKSKEPGAVGSALRWRRTMPVAVVLAVGILLSFMGFNFVISENRNNIRQSLEKAATNHAEIFRHSIDLNLTALLSIRGLFDASTSVTRTEFRVFTTPILRRLVGIQALEWIPQVPQENRQSYESAAQQDANSGFTFTERQAQGQMISAGIRDVYFPVYFVEPMERNRLALGFDLGSSAKRLNALNSARDTGKPVATAPITLVQESGSQRAFLVFVPIYKANMPIQSVDSRRANLLGFSLGVYRVGDMIEATLEKLGLHDDTSFYIFDASDSADTQLLYQRDAGMNSDEPAASADVIRSGLHTVRSLDVAGRTWEVVFKPASGQTVNPINIVAMAVLMVGVVFTALIAAYIWTALRRTERVEQLVAEQTQELTKTGQKAEAALSELASQKHAMDQHAIVAVTDIKGRITYANDKFCKISKYDRDELIGSNHRILASGHHPKTFFADMYRTIANGETWHGEIKNRAKDGSFYWVDTTIAPFKDANGKIIQYVAIRTEITERKRVENLKTEFVSIVSHELRTPLTSLVGSLGLIQGGAHGDMSAKAAKLLEIAQRNAQRLVALVNDILDIEKIESGSMELRLAACDIVALMRQVLAENEAYGEKYGVRFELDAPSDGAFVKADEERLNQVITNLLSNAAKFSPRDGVVTVKLARENENIRISVSDRGPGIPLEMQEQIFERFRQVDSSDSRKHEGTGLGLSICKQIAEKHGSEIHLKSRPGEGATFSFYLPEIDDPSLMASELDEELRIRQAQSS